MAEPRLGQRIVFLDHTAVLGGAELCLLDLVPAFAGALVCVFEDGPLVTELKARGVQVEVIESSSRLASVRRRGGLLAAAGAIPGVWRLVQSIARLTTPYDVLYANSQKSWVVAALLAWRYRRTVVWHLHDIMSGEHFDQLLARTAIGFANRTAAAVIANSKTTAGAFGAAGGRRSLVHVVHNGIDVGPFDAVKPPQVAALKRELGGDTAPLIGLFGRIAPWKGQHVLLQALAELPGVRALLVGTPLFGEHEYQARIERDAEEPAVAGRVTMLGFRSDVAALMQAVDIVVHTSVSPEPFGRVVVEGMLARRPVVATAMGGVLEIIDDGINGVLVPPGDPAALAEAIRALAADPARAERIATAGYQKARRLFGLDTMRRRVAEVLEDLIPIQRSRSTEQPCA
jgi:glycosyltransferase involved in cell wall biosynthesis